MLRKTLFFLILVPGLLFSGCQSDQQDHFAIYLLAQDLPATKLFQMDLEQLTLEDKPIISSLDILSYKQVDHTIELMPKAYDRVRKLFATPVNVAGIPFVVCVGKERIYAGAFWTPLSSLSYDGVIIMQPFEPTNTSIRIALGYPGSDVFTGSDPRADPRILKALERDDKLYRK